MCHAEETQTEIIEATSRHTRKKINCLTFALHYLKGFSLF